MQYLRLPILTFIALALALWLKAGSLDAHARGRAPNSDDKPKSEAPQAAEHAAAPAASAAPPAALELKSLASSNPYEKLGKILAAKADAIDWKALKIALVELNISIPPVSSALSTQMWKLSNAPEADKRLAWVKSTEHVVTINRYVEESHAKNDSTFLKANRALRAGQAPEGELQKYVASLRAALPKLPSLVGYTFRGAILPEKIVAEEYAEGKSVTEKAFTSSSLNPATAYSFAFPKEAGLVRGVKPLAEGEIRVIYVIHGRSARPVSYFSEYWAEAEALFDSGTEFTVKAISPKQDDASRYVILEEK